VSAKKKKQLDYFFSPGNVAVVGASEHPESIGRAIFENFLKGRFCIPSDKNFCQNVFAVNPNHETVLGAKSYASVLDVPVDLDLAIVIVPAQTVPKVLLECIKKKVKAVIIISAGFAEIGNKKLAAELQRIIDKNKRKTRVLGPNCFGVYVGENGLDTTFSEKQKMKMPKAGTVSFMSQSGALGVAVLDWASTQEFGICKFISYGNAMDLDEADLLDYLKEDDCSKVIAVYIEGVKEGKKLLKIAKQASLKKPVVVLKGGMFEETHKATASHTGSLAGSAIVYEALFKQTGIVQAQNLMELFYFAKTLASEPLPKGNRVQIITNGGGYGIITADQVVKNGLALAKMEEKNIRELKKALPSTVSVSNPMDLVGDADKERYRVAVEKALADKNVDMIIVLVLFTLPAIDKELVKTLCELKKNSAKPLVVLSIGSQYTEQRKKELEQGGIVTFKYPETAARSLKALGDYAAWLRKNKK